MALPITSRPYRVGPETHVRLFWLHGFGLRLVLVGVVILAGIAYMDILSGLATALSFAGVMAVLVIGLTVARYFYSRWLFRRPEYKANFATRTLTIDSESVRWVSDAGIDTKIPWEAFVYAQRRGGFTILFLNRMQPTTIPDEAFTSKRDLGVFLNLVTQKTKWKGKPPVIPPAIPPTSSASRP